MSFCDKRIKARSVIVMVVCKIVVWLWCALLCVYFEGILLELRRSRICADTNSTADSFNVTLTNFPFALSTYESQQGFSYSHFFFMKGANDADSVLGKLMRAPVCEEFTSF